MIRLLLAGLGGQGILSLGRFLTESGLHEGKEVTYLPAYGPEMRGGTANCSVIISKRPIASPLCTHPDVLVAMNAPSLHRFANAVVSGGLILINASLAECDAGREDVRAIGICANDLALKAGDIRSANMVMAGALCTLTRAVSEQSIFNCLSEKFSDKPRLKEINAAAFRFGVAAAEKFL